MAWGDDYDDSDEEEQQQVQQRKTATTGSSSSRSFAAGQPLVIPPTHKSRVDSKGIQIVTSYRLNPSNKNQLIKTITKIKVTTEQVKEAKAVQQRRSWQKFGQAKKDAETNTATTVQSKDDIFLENPHADTDLQDEDPAAAIAGNLNAFWAKQQRRQLERKYDVSGTAAAADDDEVGAGATVVGGLAAAAGVTGLAAAAAAGGAGGGVWTQVVAGRATGASPAAAGAAAGGKYITPAARAGMTGAGGAGAAGAGAGAFKSDRRDDLNTLRVTNLSESTTEADLQELFSTFGRIMRVYLAKDKDTMLSRGFAFVSFVNKDDAARAMEELQGYGYDHLILKIEFARPNAPKDPASEGTQFRSGYGKALAQDTKAKVSYASNLTR